MSIQARVRQFIIQNFYVSEPDQLQDDTSLIQGGYVDSTGMLEVIAFLEESFEIRVEDTETIPDNLETIGRISAYVQRKQTAAA